MKRTLILVLLVLYFCAAYGDIRTSFESFLSSELTGDIARKALIANVEINELMGDTEFKLIIRAESDSARVVDPERFYIREGYVSHDIYFDSLFDSLNLKVGKIIYSWGNADELKPVDILNPQDMTFLLFKPVNERKYGAFSCAATLYLNSNTFVEAVVIPEFVPNDLETNAFVFKDLLELMTNPMYTLNTPEMPADNMHRMNYGMRVGFMPWGMDLHLEFFKGYDKLPIIELSLITPPPVMTLSATPVYKSLEMYGLDLQKNLFSDNTLRAEIAYFRKGKFFSLYNNEADPMTSPLVLDLVSGGAGIIEKDMIEYTVGIDWMNIILKRAYLNVMVNGQIILYHNETIDQEEHTYSLISTLEYAFKRDKIRLKIREFYNINDEAMIIGFETTYRISTSFTMTFGGWIFSGDEDSYYGQFSDDDFLYLKLEAKF